MTVCIVVYDVETASDTCKLAILERLELTSFFWNITFYTVEVNDLANTEGVFRTLQNI